MSAKAVAGGAAGVVLIVVIWLIVRPAPFLEITVDVTEQGACEVTSHDEKVIYGRAYAGGPAPGFSEQPRLLRWKVGANVEADWTIRITPKAASTQDPSSSARGDLIRSRFNSGNPIEFPPPPGHSSTISPVPPPSQASILWDADGAYFWKYDVEVLDEEGHRECFIDPEVCVRRPNGTCTPP